MNTPLRSRRLFGASASFLALFSLILTLSPAVRERTWEVPLRWDHWFGFGVWILCYLLAQRFSRRLLSDPDPYLLAGAFFLSGWGLLTVWRLEPTFGARQTVWLAIATLALVFALRYPRNLALLQRYKYLILLSGLLLTALTLILGSNPSGAGPRLWIGGANLYFQPSEPLKLLLVIYLAAYFAGRLPVETFESQRARNLRQILSIPLIIPTAIMTGLSLLILLIQRDLGTASLFLLVYSFILFLATGKRRVLIVTGLVLAFSALIGYFFTEVIQARLQAWLNPWDDPSGRSYQIIQSLLAVANGGVFGRGPGLGAPRLVPVAISDFIFVAMVEETGLIGAVGLLAWIGLLLARGLRAALLAPDRFQRLLAGGLTIYLGLQSLLILGGNLRLLPLTGITLPFVSYGGSSLMTAFLALALLLRIGSDIEEEPAPLSNHRSYTLLAGLFFLGLFTIALGVGWWTIVRGPALLARTDNPRRSIADRYVRRGSLLDRNHQPITVSERQGREYTRLYLYPDLAPIIGYTHPIYGQAGLEATLDNYLRGLQGNPTRLLWWNFLIYGTPPPGLDVRLSLDLSLQRTADRLLGARAGAIVLLNAQSGEILVMASHPTYDPNLLDETGPRLQTDPNAPLLNRAAQGSYPPASFLDPLLIAHFGPDASPSADQRRAFLDQLGLYRAPNLHLPVAQPARHDTLRVSPLQMALAYACLSNRGTLPAGRIVLAVNTPAQGWVILPALDQPRPVLEADKAQQAAEQWQVPDRPFWRVSALSQENRRSFTWLAMGTLPNWQSVPLTLVVLLEESNLPLATWIGETLMHETLRPRLFSQALPNH